MKRALLSMLALPLALCCLGQESTESPRTLSFSTYASSEPVTPAGEKSLTGAGTFRSGRLATEEYEALSVRPAPSRAWQMTDITGSRQLMTAVSSTHVCYGGDASVEALGADSVKINRFCFGDVSITAHVDMATGAVTIPSQFIAEVNGAPVYLCKMNFRQQIYDKTASLRGHLYKGSIVIDDGFGFFVTEGPQAGAYLTVGLMEYGALAQPNASITARRITFKDNTQTPDNRQVTDQTSNGFAYPVSDTRLRLMRMPVASSYSNINLTLGSDGSVTIDPQAIANVTLYGDFYFYKMTERTENGQVKFSVSVLNPVEAIYTNGDKQLNWGSWAVARTNALLGTYESTSVTLTDGIVFPTATSMHLEGEGTAASPWLIKSRDDLVALASDISVNTACRGALTTQPSDADKKYYPVYAGKYFRLANDIDMGADNPGIQPIGNDTYWFAGILQGGGHTISNLAIENFAYDYCGLFSRLAPGSQVDSLTFSHAYVSTLGYTAGILAGRNYAPVRDVTITDSRIIASAGYNVGMLAGYNHAALKNITVTGAYALSLGYMGGIAGRSYADMTDCHVQGRIIQAGKQTFSGGLVGHQTKVAVEDPAPVISGCSFTGNVQTSADEIGIGGLCGALSYSRLENSFANAVVANASSISAYVGGLVGTTFASQITDCYATGFVRNPESTTCGGLVGHNTKGVSASNPTEIKSSYFSGMLLTKSTSATRGITGDSENFVITDCHFDNQIAVAPGADGGLSTAELAGGTLPKGFSADVWKADAGQYPALKALPASDAKAVSTAAITLAAGQNVNDVQNDFTYAPADGITWAALKGNNLDTTGGYAFNFDNGTARINYEQHTDTVYATKGIASKYWFVNVAPVLFPGSGTAEDPWIISNKDDLQKFASISNNARMTFSGRHLALGADIDCQGDTLVPVCRDHSAKLLFEGSFDGRGHTIDNFRIEGVGFFTADNVTGTAVPGQVNPKDPKSIYYTGLFGNVGKSGVVRNVTIGSRALVQIFQYGGAIAGGSEGLIENCRNLGEVRGYFSNVGGIVGTLKAGGKVRDCFNGGGVYVNANTAGGIVGQAVQASIENVENTGEVKAYWFNPYQKEAAQYGAGGIAGLLDRTTLTNAVNSGIVSSYKQVGGIASKVSATAALPAIITAAVNYGLVYSWTEQTSLGAIAGLNTLGTFVNCLADKQIQKAGLVSNGLCDGTMHLPTLQLVSAQGYPAQYLPDSAFVLTAGKYPAIRFSGAQPAQSVLNSSAVIRFPANDFAQAMMSDAPLSQGVNWSLVQNGVFSIADGTLKVMMPMAGCFTDTVVASLNGCVRKLPVATLNPTLTDGEGTMNKPYLISEPTEWLAVARFMKQWNFDYQGYYFKLMNNLDFKDLDFVPLGADGVMFNGSFDGNSKKILNVSYTSAASDKTAIGRGLFGTLGYDGFVSSLTLAQSAVSGYQNVGGIAGISYGNMLDCHNAAAVSTLGTTGAGGIAGYAYPGAQFMMCSNSGAVTAKTNYAGGILGAAPASARIQIDECENTGIIAGASKIGGIAGSGSIYISASKNSGKVATTATGTYAAGILAEALLPSGVKECSNDGEIFANQYCAGIVSLTVAHTAANPFELTRCFNTADLTSGAKGYMAGVGGTIKAGALITGCYNTGKMTGGATNTMRIAGVISDLATTAGAPSLVRDCHNTGEIISWSNSGGVIGAASGDSLKIINCYNTGNVTGNFTTATNVGGIMGNGPAEYRDCWNSGTIVALGKQAGGINGTNTSKSPLMTRCVNVGNVTAATSDAGGMIGLGRATMIDCYNLGSISAPTAAGGLLGEPGAAAAAVYTVTVRDCYNAGKVTASSNWGNVMGKNASCKFLNVSRTYACTDTTQLSAYDSELKVQGKSTAELCEMSVSDAFLSIPATFPTLKTLQANDTLNFHAATVIPASGESLDAVRTVLQLGMPHGAAWTSSTEDLRISGHEAVNRSKINNQAATLTLTCGGMTRVYNLNLLECIGVDAIDGDADVVDEVWFTADGLRAARPAERDGRIYIVVRRYADGSSRSMRVLN